MTPWEEAKAKPYQRATTSYKPAKKERAIKKPLSFLTEAYVYARYPV